MPSSERGPSQSAIHLEPNSEFSSASGMKSREKTERRPSLTVPAMRSEGMFSTPSSTRPAMLLPSRRSSRTARYGQRPCSASSRYVFTAFLCAARNASTASALTDSVLLTFVRLLLAVLRCRIVAFQPEKVKKAKEYRGFFRESIYFEKARITPCNSFRHRV